MDRRTFLKGAGALVLAPAAASIWSRPARAQADADAAHLELVTLSDSDAVLTFESLQPTEALVRWGSTPDEFSHEASDPTGRSRYHRLEIGGLSPGQQVYYAVEVDGVRVQENPYSPGQFESLVPPEGPELFTFATLTDMHCGLMSAGAVGGISSFEPVECPLGDPTCWQVANREVIAAINRSPAAFSIAKGDLSHEYLPEEFEAARALLDGLDQPYHPVRGNHDRQGERPEDLFPKVFDLEATHYGFDHQGVRFLVLDSSKLETGFPEIGEAQFGWLEDQLRVIEPTQVFFLVLHHAVTEESSALFSLFGQDQQRLFGLLSNKHGLAGILSGHSHRNIVTHQPELGQVPCVETSTTVHYPGGYNLYRVHTGGYLQTYHKIDGLNWRQWEEAGHAMYKGDAQQVLMGSLADCNFVHAFHTPLAAPDDGQGGCACSAAAGPSGPLALGLATSAAALIKRQSKTSE